MPPRRSHSKQLNMNNLKARIYNENKKKQLSDAYKEHRKQVREYMKRNDQVSELESVKPEIRDQVSELKSVKTEIGNQASELKSVKTEIGDQVFELENIKVEMGDQAFELESIKVEMGDQASELKSVKPKIRTKHWKVLKWKTPELE
ncbi:3256_t:CDS:1 [Racocetra persica]|uniref:3256_t:CDS:1 n=1 Tax=Racocetra persica TaxID=160502 RepID=A0ACA9QZU3_9GLOM|nr:3256_t:CDS:1 [Racocetra persica]